MENILHAPLQVSSETGRLRKVIIHRPDEGIELVTPDKAQEYLYEDIVFLKKMKEEHDIFSGIIKSFIGNENVLDVQNLLTEALSDKKVKDDLIDAVCQFEDCRHESTTFHELSAASLAYTFITGKIRKSNKIVFAPISNFIFCRDVGVMVNDHLLICEASKSARSRESLLCRFIFRHTVLFQKTKIVEISSLNIFLENLKNDEKPVSIEGGDVMMIHPDHLLIGHSERTTPKAIEHLCKILFAHKVVKTITSVSIPKQRFCMHLDTIFTMIDSKDCVAFEPLICEDEKLDVVQYVRDINTKVYYSSLKTMLLSVFPDLTIIPCGGGVSPYAEREQWTDGCNLFAIRAGVAVTYDRNHHTAKALKDMGYNLINARKLLQDFKSGKSHPENIQKTIILIPSNELSRARGGTHCLTFPIHREP